MPFFQQGFPCMNEKFSVVSCSQPGQWSGNSWLAGWLVSNAHPAICPCQGSSHNSLFWKASSFPLVASSIRIPLRVSDNKYYKITQIQMVWVGVASCSTTCESPLLSCSLASTESISSVFYGLIAFLYKPSITHSSWDIFNFHCRYIRKREAKQIWGRYSKNLSTQKLRIIFQTVIFSSQEHPSLHLWKETSSGVQLIFTNSFSMETYS